MPKKHTYVDRYGFPVEIGPHTLSNPSYISKREAVARCGIETKQFVALVKEGIFPPSEPDGKWHRRNLDAWMESRKFQICRVSDGWVYFMEMGDFIKIGWSSWPDSRREQLQTSNPYDIIILCAFPGTLDAELAVHTAFAHARHRNEWFRKTPGLLAYIAWMRVIWRGNADFLRGDLANVVHLRSRGNIVDSRANETTEVK